jgi:hypothetical protein
MKAIKLSILILVLLSFVGPGCSNKPKTIDNSSENITDTTNQVNNLDQINDYIAAKTDSFYVDPTKDTLIKCKKGTVLYFTANSLELEDGSKPSGNILIQVKECYSLSEIIGDNLSTTSNSELLETGGMINISVSNEGKLLNLKKGKEYALYFPKNEQGKDMNTFYGFKSTTGDIDWKMDTTSKALPSEENIIDEQLKDCHVWLNGRTTMIGPKDVKWELKNSDQTVMSYFDDNFKPSKQMNQDFCDKDLSITTKFNINRDGKIVNFRIEESATPEHDKVISDFLLALPPIDITTMGIYTINQEYSLLFHKETIINNKVYNTQFKAKYKKFRNQAITQIDKAELNYYVLTASKLGWINFEVRLDQL